ncbi:xanthine dehydrogenase YagR molybdenum-binding subunit [Actinopolyspora biskrensis]|uniref:Xanthine dehydrogenase YagR molybdenum-binding subunit n=1 Tax=Actinopolyspora biskrensis TaxID=1470178 RepID=A0A852Z6L3_9ACTN|nr:xanthine dehydrogenase family protein molybdopterin-binding subunit [Actinopolyspora biskrensis]NYH77843.1 xanthine dehydrogenase YagR molybdenum-binding subunit [Actinopolyspora biskrensis]
MTQDVGSGAVGSPVERLDGQAKVTGNAPYAFEQLTEGAVYLHPLRAPVARGRVTEMDTSAAEAVGGVRAILLAGQVEQLDTRDRELAVLQSREVAFRGQYVGAVLATTPENARHAASLVRVSCAASPPDVALEGDRADLYAPEVVNPRFGTDTEQGDTDSAFEEAAYFIDRTYRTPMEHNNPMEPHATVAHWDGGELSLYDSTQGAHSVRATLAPLFGLPTDRVRVQAPHVGGGFGSKGLPHANVVLAALAARSVPGTPVKFAVTRQQIFTVAGHRTPTIQRIRLGATRSGELTAITHDVVEHTSRIKEFAEQTAVPTRNMYRAANRRTTHRLAALDVPVPSWMRAPGECPGMFALESAVDEMARECGQDPVEFRIRNEPSEDPETGLPFSSHNLATCLRRGAEGFGWYDRNAPARSSPDAAGWIPGVGVAASTYPVFRSPGSRALVLAEGSGRYRVSIGAVDIGTGARTALTQIAADALGTEVSAIDLRIADTALPYANVAGGSSGTTCWGTAIHEAAGKLRAEHGSAPLPGASAEGETTSNPESGRFAMHAYGAQFAEVRVHADTGEVRVPRMLGVFAVGRVINPRTARSQFLGGMTMGLSMALHEEAVLDHELGHVVNQDLAEYHIATNADVGAIEITWLDEQDPHVNPMGSKGIGEIGIVGTAAAVANAVQHATGVRVRQLPITPDKLIS